MIKNKESRKCIYELRHPDTDIPVYVGMTTQPYYRFHEHKSPRTLKRVKHNKLQLWIKSLLDQGKMPVMKIVKDLPNSFTRKQMIQAEKEHILEVLKKHKLFNLFIGSNHTKQTKAWVIKGNKNRIISNEMKKKISKANTKYIFKYRDQTVMGLVALSKIIGIKPSSIHYKISNNKEIEGVTLARY